MKVNKTKQNKRIINTLILIIALILSFFAAFWVKFIPFYKETAVFIICLLICFVCILSFFINNGIFNKISHRKDVVLEELNFQNETNETVSDLLSGGGRISDSGKQAVSVDALFNELLYPLQLVQASAKILNSPVAAEKQISAGKIIEENVLLMKRLIGAESPETEKLQENDTNRLPFALQTINVEDAITQSISVAIFGKNDVDNLRLKLILQVSGFFCRIFTDVQDALIAIDENLFQFLIIVPESETDISFSLCKKIREKRTLLDFPILILVNKFLSYLIEVAYELQINDFIIRPFDTSELISRIQTMISAQTLYRENQELFNSEKEKRTFLYFVTHNVNTPLTILLNEIHQLSSMPVEPEIGEMVSNIRQAANQIDVIIQNVLASYKLSDGRYMLNPKIVNLSEFLELENNYILHKALYKQQQLIYECQKKTVLVYCDENSLKGIYTNLVDNAIKYSPIGGKISVTVFDDDEYVYLYVMDNGPGIPKEKQAVLFNRFAGIGSKPTGSEKSVGLGLYVVNEICKINKIELSYQDNEYESTGSCFIVTFPRLGA